MARGAIDGVDRAFVDGGVSQADLLYLAMPVLSILEFLTQTTSRTKPGAIITDTGSTKRDVCEAASKYLTDRQFIGGHPIAGSHLSGPNQASAELMAGACYVLIDDLQDAETFSRLEQTVKAIGAQPSRMTASEHDRAFALISHLPQLLASALAGLVQDQDDANSLLELAGPGYRDMTRLAQSSWSIWSDVLTTNRAEISTGLDQMIDKLTLIRGELEDNKLLDDSILSRLFRH